VTVVTGNYKCRNQIIHIDGMCNECGNCEAFCPYDSAPYRDKFTLYWNREDFENSDRDGFFLLDKAAGLFLVRLNKRLADVTIDRSGNCSGDIPEEIRDLIRSLYQNYSYVFMDE
jgi:putative selenate reductase